MKILFTFLLLWAGSSFAQVYDTLPAILPVYDTTSYYIIKNNKGKQVDMVTSLQPWSIPSGGSATKDKFVNMQEYGLWGYVILENGDKYMRAIKYLGTDRKSPIPKPYVLSRWHVPVNGNDFRQLY